ncbi:MAG: hypothetical protein SVS15_01155 [Thermodesulfobacteriota bacterium]|nr:hypothetical protein [Thermodesulfobacteriota bacterium]
MEEPTKKSMPRLFAGMAVLFLWGVLSVIPAQAADKYWNAGDGDWNVGTNWNPAGVPVNSDAVYLTSIDAVSRTVEYFNSDTNMILNSLRVDATGAGTTMTLNLDGTASSKLTSGPRYIGYSGTGVLTHIEGSFGGGPLYLGHELGSSGTYNFNGGNMGGNQHIGYHGTGVFTQTGGTNLLDYNFNLGVYSSGKGTYNLSGGEINGGLADELIGLFGTGEFIQTGGTHTAGSMLSLGHFSGGTGTYDLIDGDLTSGFIQIGNEGTGEFTQSGGTHEVVSGLYLGHGLGGSGTYELSGGSLETTGSNEYIGYGGTGIFTQTGGTNTVGGTLHVGTVAGPGPGGGGGGSGTYNLTGAEVSAETINVTDSSEMHLSGGTVSAGGGGMMNQGLVTMTGAPNTFNGDVVNHGTFTATETTVSFTGSYTEHGVFVSDPSTINFSDWTIGETGYVTAGLGDLFNVSGDFVNNSLAAGLWDTDQASLCLTGEIQQMALAGAEMGALFSGYDNNFAWGEFSLESGVNLNISDGNGVGGAALYVGLVAFEDGLGQLEDIFSEYNIYYNAGLMGNEWLGGLTYDLAGSGQLIPIGTLPPPVPIPGAVWLLGTGLLGLLGLRRKFRK